MEPARHRPVQVFGFTTSVERAQKQNLATNSTSGTKRVLSDDHDHQHIPRILKLSKRTSITASEIVGVDAATRAERLQHSNVTQSPTENPLLSLSHPAYDLPSNLVFNLASLGISAIYPWQSSCLLGRGLLDGRQSLIYTAPTGGGKSLVADVLMLKRVSEGGKAVLVLPYVALVQEKLRWLRRVVDGLPIRVAGFVGGGKAQTHWSDFDIAVCTIEKANILVNTAIEEGRIGDLKVLVLDELHMLDDEHRGYLMELMATKLLMLGRVQIIGMSATLSNPELLADWLGAKFYVSRYRPVPIEEHIVYNNAIYPTANSKDFFRTAGHLVHQSTPKPPTPSHTIAESVHQELGPPMLNSVVALAVETVVSGFGALIFCNSRQSTQSIALLVSQALPSMMTDQRADVLASLQALSAGFESTFSQTIPAGVAFHHAGLTIEERAIVAEAYDVGILKVMVATCSLAAGINLPARRVIIHGARMGRDIVGPAMLRQMRGRAGRKGKDEIGQTYLCCQKTDLETVAELLEAELPPVVSCLVSEKRGLKRAILEVIATRLASSHESLLIYINMSLLWQTTDHDVVKDMLESALQSLLQDELIQMIPDNAYIPTRVGSAIVGAGFNPEDGVFVHNDLRNAISSFVMDSDLHIFYLFTPIPQLSTTPLTSEISWPIFRNVLDSLDEASIRALRLIGVSPALVNSMAQSGMPNLKETTSQELKIARIYRRIYSTFALRDLCNEVPVSTIALKYNLPRGQIQNLAQTCHGFAAGMIKFCQRMSTSSTPSFPNFNITTSHRGLDPQAAGFSMLGAVLEHMQDRLKAGARGDLLEMAQVTFVKGRMARILYENGFKGIRALADADPKRDILPIMLNLSGWKLKSRSRQQQHMRQNTEENDARVQEEEMKRKKLEEKLLSKAEVLVRSAARIWEQQCLQQLLADEE